MIAPATSPAPLRLPARIAVAAGSGLLIAELLYRRPTVAAAGWVDESLGPLASALLRYAYLRELVLKNPALALSVAAFGAVAFLLLYRSALTLWHNQVLTRLAGIHFDRSPGQFPSALVDILGEVARLAFGNRHG